MEYAHGEESGVFRGDHGERLAEEVVVGVLVTRPLPGIMETLTESMRPAVAPKHHPAETGVGKLKWTAQMMYFSFPALNFGLLSVLRSTSNQTV